MNEERLSKKLDNVENIVKFLRSLPTVNQFAIASLALFNEMEHHKHSDDPIVMFFEYEVSHSGRCQDRVDCLSVGIMLKARVATILDAWANSIRSKQYEKIAEYDKKYVATFRYNLGKLIEKTYGNDLAQAKTIMEFIDKLPYVQEFAMSYFSLFQKMKENNHLDSQELITLAYRVKRDMDSYLSILTPEFQKLYTDVKSNLPIAVRSLIWNGQSCTIKNIHHNEYLYAASSYRFDDNRRRVFTWSPGGSVTQGYWKIDC